ncbi:hypothetical protein C8R43DRAFT_1130210 [Mycena crocata]|nr:hypothetical protein C8R43DRAFT_1130210 [Mycena crocata]
MALTVPSWDDHAQPISTDLGPLPYEDIQYFSHMQTHRPPRAVSGFTNDPEETVRNAVTRQWRNYTTHTSLDVNPTFAASPQSDYGGCVTLPSGQVLHRSVGLNVLHVFRNPETGAPFSVACHEFTYHLEAEQDLTKPWPLEVILPSKQRLREAMFDMTPLDPPGEGETGFPNHTANYTPPMIPISQRIEPERPPPAFEEAHAPLSASITARLDKLTAIPEHRGSGLSSDALAQLAADIRTRAVPGLSFGEIDLPAGHFSYRIPDFSETDSVPDLKFAKFAWDPRIFSPAVRKKDDLNFLGLHKQGQLTTLFIQTAPFQLPLRTSLAMPSKQRNKRDTEEVRDSLEFVLAPLVEEIMRMPISGTNTHRRLATQAREVQVAFGAFAKKMEEKQQRDEHFETEMLTRLSEDVLTDQMDSQTHVSRLTTPALSGRRGPLVTRDEWSSSSAPLPSATDSSFDPDYYSLPPPTTRLGIERGGSLSPITECDLDSEISIPLANIAGPAFFSSGSPGYARIPEGPSYFNTLEFERQRRQLNNWIRFGKSHLDEHSRQEDEVASYPLQHALDTLHGALREFIDYPAMAAGNFRTLQLFSPLPMGDPSSVTADLISDSPDPTQSPTSLDFSLPNNESSTATTENFPASSNNVDDAAATGTKRKESGQNTESQSAERPQKRHRKFDGDLLRRRVTETNALKATHILEVDVIRKLAGVRLATLEGARIIESIGWHRYDISPVREIARRNMFPAANFSSAAYRQEYLPDGYIMHPYLYDLEAAKMHTLWDVLRYNGRDKLADLLFDILSIRLRDEYTVSQVLNAQGLELAYPETQNQYHILLGVPPYQHSFGPAEFDIDSDSEASAFEGMDLGYPDDEYEGSISVDGFPDDIYDRDFREDSISVEDTSEIMFAQPREYDEDISYNYSTDEASSEYMEADSDADSNTPLLFRVDSGNQGPGLYLRDIDDGSSHDSPVDDGHIAASQSRFDWSVPFNSVRRVFINLAQISTT